MSDPKEHRLFVGSVEKAFDFLEVFDSNTKSLSLTELVQRTGLPKSAAQRYAYTLETLGYLNKDPESRRYRLSLKTLFAAGRFISQNEMIHAAYPHLVQLRQQLDARIGLSVQYQERIVYLIPLQSSREAYQTDYPGFSVPIHCTTSGRLFLAQQSDAEARSRLKVQERPALTPFSKTDIDDIMGEVSDARQQGYCITQQEYRIGNLNLGVPVFDREQKLAACLIAVVQTAHWDIQRLKQEAWPLLQETASRIQIIRRE